MLISDTSAETVRTTRMHRVMMYTIHCADLRLPRRIYPDHHVLPRELFTDYQWNEMIVNPLPSPTRHYYQYFT